MMKSALSGMPCSGVRSATDVSLICRSLIEPQSGEVVDLGAAQVEREPAVIADGQALGERVLRRNREVLEPREPVVEEKFVFFAEQPRYRHEF